MKFRKAVIHSSWKNELYKYITGIVQHYDHKMLAIYGMENHVHILIGMRPTQSVSTLLKEIKGSSSKWINEQKFTKVHFSWQEGFGAFSYSKSQMGTIIKYIENQEEHHRKKTFHEEYIDFLEKFSIEYDKKNIFKDLIE